MNHFPLAHQNGLLHAMGSALCRWAALPGKVARPPHEYTHDDANAVLVKGTLGQRQWQQVRYGAWDMGWCLRIGTRHAQARQICEDKVAIHFTADGGAHGVVADGVSGGAKGDVCASALTQFASQLQVDYPPPPSNAVSTLAVEHGQSLKQQLAQADTLVQQALQAQAPGLSGACTFSAVWLGSDGLGWVSRVGDTRVYHWRERARPAAADGESSSASVQLQRAMPDQTFAELSEMPPPGVPLRNPARMCGNSHMGDIELRPVQLLPGDGLLLCSDGVHDVLGDDTLAQLLATGLRRGYSPLRLAHSIERQARRCASEDDISVLVLRYAGTDKATHL